MARALKDLVEAWGETRGLTPRGDADDRHFFVFDGDYELGLCQFGPRMTVEAELCPLPVRRDEAEALLDRLLPLQLAKSRDGAEAIALNAEGDTLMLVRSVPISSLSQRDFEAVLARFVNALAFWSTKVASGHAGALPTPAPTQIVYP